MSKLYGDDHRALQDMFDSRKLADRIEEIAVKTEITDEERPFIESRDMFFLATTDHKGRPTVSYKGGDPGFVKVLDANTVAFPSYNGNGMFLSMGNIKGQGQIGILFIDIERPFRMRLQGQASVSQGAQHLSLFKEAELVVLVKVSEIWINFPRYVHRYQKVKTSRYVLREGEEITVCEWKRVDAVYDVLPERDRPAVEIAGTIPIEEWIGRVKSGDERA